MAGLATGRDGREVQRHERGVHRHRARREPAAAPSSTGRHSKPATSPSWFCGHQVRGQGQVEGMQVFELQALGDRHGAGAARLPAARRCHLRRLQAGLFEAFAHQAWRAASGRRPRRRRSGCRAGRGRWPCWAERRAIHRWRRAAGGRTGDIAVGMGAQGQRAPEARGGALGARQALAGGEIGHGVELVAPGAHQAPFAQAALIGPARGVASRSWQLSTGQRPHAASCHRAPPGPAVRLRPPSPRRCPRPTRARQLAPPGGGLVAAAARKTAAGFVRHAVVRRPSAAAAAAPLLHQAAPTSAARP